MKPSAWKRQLLGTLGVVTLGLAGTAAWAQDGAADAARSAGQPGQQAPTQGAKDSAQEASGNVQQHTGDEALGGAGQSGVGDDVQGSDEEASESGAKEDGAAPEAQEAEEAPPPDDAAGTGGAGSSGLTPDQRAAERTPGEVVDGAAADVSQSAEEARREMEAYIQSQPQNPELRVTAQGGVQSWAGEVGSVLNAGPSWGVSVGSQLWNLVGVEVGYQGSRNAFSDEVAGSGSGAALFRHGADALAKVGPTLQNGLRPFVGAGLGVSLVNPTRGAEGLATNDVLAEVPVAAGLEYDTGLLTAGLRGTARWTLGEEFAEPVLGEDADGSILGAALTFGGRF
jgi:opacity protein-like surface antigen